ncbi:MAG: hypothetical protein CSA66_07245 [Proteobacteria bacterium]|nr:MAG: hypothetical protein CSA66_07245 [Pseudomonadota bacterium]
MIASQVMTPEPHTARPYHLVGDALDVMADKGLRHLPVTADDRRLLGVVSDRLLRAAVAADATVAQRPLATVMTTEPVTVGPATPVPVIIDRLLGGGLRLVPVVDGDGDGVLVGVISCIDVLRTLRRSQAEAEGEVPGAACGPALGVKKVLVPLAGDELSHLALRLVATLFRDAEVHACQVLHVHTPMVPSAFLGRVDDSARIKSTRAAIDKRIRAAGFEPPALGVRMGTPVTEICDYAKEQDIELIVMPSRKRHTVKRMILGSVAEGVVAHSPCPVLVLRGDLPQTWEQHIEAYRSA